MDFNYGCSLMIASLFSSCAVCGDSNDFRVLSCGHPFCVECLQTLFLQHNSTVPCPVCRTVDETMPLDLPTVEAFEGKVFFTRFDSEHDIGACFADVIKCREKTIEELEKIIQMLKNLEKRHSLYRVVSSSVSVLGTGLTIGGLAMSATGVGVVAGAPLAIVGATVATGGGVATGSSLIYEALRKKTNFQEINEHMQRDYFKWQQLKVVIDRAGNGEAFAAKWKFDLMDVSALASLAPRIMKTGATTVAGARAISAVLQSGVRVAGTTTMHVAGIFFAVALLPIDVGTLIYNSFHLFKNNPTEVIRDLQRRVDGLTIELKAFLVNTGFFKLFSALCDCKFRIHWCYVIITPRLSEKVNNLYNQGNLMYEDVNKYCERIVCEGVGLSVPKLVAEKMNNDWYSIGDQLILE